MLLRWWCLRRATRGWSVFGRLPTTAGIAVRMAGGVGVEKPSASAAPSPAGPSSGVVVPQRTAPTAAVPPGTSPLSTAPAAAPASSWASTASAPVHAVVFVTVAIRPGSTSRRLPTTWSTGVVGSHHGGIYRHARNVRLPVHGAGRGDPAPGQCHVRLLRPSHGSAHARRRSRGVVRTRGWHPVRHGRHLGRRRRLLQRHRRRCSARRRVRRTLGPGTGRLRFSVVSVVFGGGHGRCGSAGSRARRLRAGGSCGGWWRGWTRRRRTHLGHCLWHHWHGLLHAGVRIPHSLVLRGHHSHHSCG